MELGEKRGGCREAEKQQSKVKVVVGGGGGWYERIFVTSRPCQLAKQNMSLAASPNPLCFMNNSYEGDR